MTSDTTPATPGADIFPHDRVVFFSDAVFAIAMTLLAVELKLPADHVPDGQAMGELTATFTAYLVSFAVLGVFWTSHMLTWKHVSRVNGRIVWLTLLQLMFVALMPFAAREFSLSMGGGSVGRVVLYACVLTAISFFSLRTRWIVVKQEHLREKIGETETRWFLSRGAVPLCVFAAMVPLAFVVPAQFIACVYAAIFPLLVIIRRRIFRNPNP